MLDLGCLEFTARGLTYKDGWDWVRVRLTVKNCSSNWFSFYPHFTTGHAQAHLWSAGDFLMHVAICLADRARRERRLERQRVQRLLRDKVGVVGRVALADQREQVI